MGKIKEESPRIISRNIQPQGRSKLAPKGSDSEVPTGEFYANEVWNSNLGLKFQARGIVFQDLKIRISLCTARFSSEPTKWKADGHCYDFKFNFKKHEVYVNTMISTNSLFVYILHHNRNGLGNKNLCSIQEIMCASEPAAKKYKRVCEDFPDLAILTKSAAPGKFQLTFGHATVGNKSIGEFVVAFALAGDLSSYSVVSIKMGINFSGDGDKIRRLVILAYATG